MQEPGARDERGQAIRARLLQPCAGGKPFLVQSFKGNVALCGCHYSATDSAVPLSDIPEHQAVVKVKPGALPKGAKQLSRERVLPPSEQAGRTRSGESGRKNIDRFAEEFTFSKNAATCHAVPPYIKAGADVLYGKQKPRIARVVHVGVVPREPGDQHPAISIRLAGKLLDVPVNSLRAPPPPPPPLTFDPNPGGVEAVAQYANVLESQNAVLASKLVAEQKNTADANARAKEAAAGKLSAQQELLHATKCDYFPKLRKELKLYWDKCLELAADSPEGECPIDFMSMSVAKELLAKAGAPFKYTELEKKAGKPPTPPKIPADVDASECARLNPAMFEKWISGCAKHRTSTKQVLGVFLLEISVTSERCKTVAGVIDRLLGKIPKAHKDLLHHAFGVGTSQSKYQRDLKERKQTYHKCLDAKLLKVIQALIEDEGKGWLALGWDDDYTKVHYKTSFSNGEDARTFFYWTTVAFRVKRVEGAQMPRANSADPKYTPFNPEGFSPSTVTDLLSEAGPGGPSMTEYLDKVLLQPCHGGVGVDAAHASDKSPLQVDEVRKRTRSVNYSSQAAVDNEAALKDGTYFVDALDQNFKSYQVCARLAWPAPSPSLVCPLQGGRWRGGGFFYVMCPKSNAQAPVRLACLAPAAGATSNADSSSVPACRAHAGNGARHSSPGRDAGRFRAAPGWVSLADAIGLAGPRVPRGEEGASCSPATGACDRLVGYLP